MTIDLSNIFSVFLFFLYLVNQVLRDQVVFDHSKVFVAQVRHF